MGDIELLASRVDTLEMRAAYQDQTIEDLNATITAQWSQIEGLARELRRLSDRMQQAEDRAAGSPVQEPPPPHY